MSLPRTAINARRAFRDARTNNQRLVLAHFAKEAAIRNRRFHEAARWRDIEKQLNLRPIIRVN